MGRIISNDFVRELESDILKDILEAVKKDNRLCLEIRDAFINIYYRGGSLMKIEEKKTGAYRFYFDRDYLDQSNTKVSVGEQVIAVTDPQSLGYVQTWIEEIPFIKHEMDLWFNKHPKEEREYQQLVLHENNYGGASNDTDYYICDIEYANRNDRFNGRFDMIAVKWPSKSADRKNGNNLKLAFIEMKYADKALTGKSGILEHITNMNQFLNNIKVLDEIKKEMQDIFNLKIKLGLIQNIKNIISFNLESAEKPEYILLLANHDPDKTVLARELKQLLMDPNYISLKQKVDLKVAVASFMGYGLYQECIFDIQTFVDKYLKYNEPQNHEIVRELNEILKNLDYKFMSLEEYLWKCSKGVLVKKKLFEDDLAFYTANPENPMASENRFVRSTAADKLLRFVKTYREKITEYFSDEIVDFINIHLSDCNAAVRQSLMLCLALINNKKSLEFFKRLVYFEESPSTKRMLEFIIEEIESGRNDLRNDPELKYFLV